MPRYCLGEIRVGVSHQAITPVCNPDPHSEEAVADFASMQPMETLLWKPTLPKSKLMVYLRAGKQSNKCRGSRELCKFGGVNCIWGIFPDQGDKNMTKTLQKRNKFS